MTRAPGRVSAPLVAILLAIGAFAGCSRAAEAPPADRPALLLLTSLPLIFGDQFSLEGGGSRALEALESRYRVVPISTTSPSELAKGRLLLMAHPQAQTAENLVALDDWVRAGGRVLLLADPLLEWPSKRPLGDPLRPPPMFSDTGLLRHWGLRLDAPDQAGPAMRRLGKYEVMTAGPGSLHGACGITPDRLASECAIGKGRVVVVADADLLGVEHLDGPIDNNLGAVLDVLATLSGR